MNTKRLNTQVTVLLFIVGLCFIGIALPYPVLTPLILNSKENFISSYLLEYFSRPFLLGVLLASYPLGQFLGMPILGAISDLVGRKKILVFTLTGTLFGYLLSIVAISLHAYLILFFARFWTGICEGNFGIAQAAIADVSTQENKTKLFGLVNGVVALGYVLGPIIGGIVAGKNIFFFRGYDLPFLMAAILTGIGILITHFYFQETYKKTKIIVKYDTLIKTICLAWKNLSTDIIECIGKKTIINSLLLFLFFYISIDLFYEFYPMYFVYKWEFTPINIAIFSAVYTVPYGISQIFLVPKLSVVTRPEKVLVMTGILVGIMFIILLSIENHNMLYVVLPILGILLSFCSTNTAVILSNSVLPDEYGKIFGVAQSLRMFNDFIFTIIVGKLTLHFTGTPFIVASVISIVSCLFIFRLLKEKL